MVTRPPVAVLMVTGEQAGEEGEEGHGPGGREVCAVCRVNCAISSVQCSVQTMNDDVTMHRQEIARI